MYFDVRLDFLVALNFEFSTLSAEIFRMIELLKKQFEYDGEI